VAPLTILIVSQLKRNLFMEKSHSTLDKTKFNRWLNIRKTTLKELNRKLKDRLNFEISFNNCETIDDYAISLISDCLDISSSKITKLNLVPTFILKTKKEIEDTKRPINKDGIHFYNYYTLPTPSGYVAPVLLDIMCPKDKLPKLNNGHLEPAITISIGPNDIYARFTEKLDKDSWVKFEVNKNKKTNWIVGSSYYEPSFCRHSYSRVNNGLGRIISYTTKSNIENLLNDKLNDNSFENLARANKGKKINRTLLKLEIESKGYSISEIAKKIKLSLKKLKNFLNNSKSILDKKYIIKICQIINSDPNLFLDKKQKEDSVGKLYFDYKKSIKSIRKFKSYQVASIANSKRFPDLSGYFMKVDSKKNTFFNDLFDSKCSHYFVTGGKIKIYINSKNKKITKNLNNGDCLWISAFTHHGFTGFGSLLKISDGQNISYLDKEDLTNTYNINGVLNRVRGDMQNWGHDEK